VHDHIIVGRRGHQSLQGLKLIQWRGGASCAIAVRDLFCDRFDPTTTHREPPATSEWEEKHVTRARCKHRFRCAVDSHVLYARSYRSSQDQQIGFLPGQLPFDQNHGIAGLDGQQRSALGQPQSLDQAGKRLLGTLADQAR
jgi:hypothetical protein